MRFSFPDFVEGLSEIVTREKDNRAAIPELTEPLLRRLLEDPSWSEYASQRLPTASESRRLLHRQADGTFAIWSMRFEARHATPIHDHKSWGLVGVWHGQEIEDRFRLAKTPGLKANIDLTSTVVN